MGLMQVWSTLLEARGWQAGSGSSADKPRGGRRRRALGAGQLEEAAGRNGRSEGRVTKCHGNRARQRLQALPHSAREG